MPFATSILLALAAPQAPIGTAVTIAEHAKAAAERPLSKESWVLQNSYNAFLALEETPSTRDMLKAAIGSAQLKDRWAAAPII